MYIVSYVRQVHVSKIASSLYLQISWWYSSMPRQIAILRISDLMGNTAALQCLLLPFLMKG